MKKKNLYLILMLLLAALQVQGEPLHVVILGDSNTWLGGDDCSKPEGWNTWFKEAFGPASCRSYARSGATWTNTPTTKRNLTENIGVLGNDNAVYNQIERLKQACKEGLQTVPDLIIVAAGTNDAWFADKRPQAFSRSVDEAFSQQDGLLTGEQPSHELTLARSVRYGCELLMEAFPQAQIVLLTPLQSTAAPAQLITKVGDVIEECAHRMALGVVRMDREGCVYAARERVKKTFTKDGTHTNEAGARRNGYLVARKLKMMR